MTDTDVLVKWGDIISVAESGSKAIDYYAPSPLADCIADLAAEVRTQRERAGKMEADAKLGRMVREMPRGAFLQHCVYTNETSDFAYLEPRPKWGALSSYARHADTPDEAILAVRNKP